MYRLSGIPSHPTEEGGGKDQVYLVLEACNGMIVENDLIVSSNIHLGSEEGAPIQIHFSVVFNLVVVVIYMNFLGSDEFSEHDFSLFMLWFPCPFSSFPAPGSSPTDAS
jgi:hypothetical protein